MYRLSALAPDSILSLARKSVHLDGCSAMVWNGCGALPATRSGFFTVICCAWELCLASLPVQRLFRDGSEIFHSELDCTRKVTIR